MAEGGEAILEDGDLVVVGRDLRGPLCGGRAQRALVGRRQERAALPMRGDRDPLFEERVVAQLGGERRGGQLAPVRPVPHGVVALVEVDYFAAIGEVADRALHRVVHRRRTELNTKPHYSHTFVGIRGMGANHLLLDPSVAASRGGMY
jgi:hypothetical protein